MKTIRSLMICGFTLGLILFKNNDASAENWTRFRGPNGTGTVSDQDIPLNWSPQEGVLWKVAIPGKGNSSPVVWGNKLFLQSSAQDGSERMLLCLDAKTGQTLWTQSAPAKRVSTHQKNTMASSTPTTDGRHVFALFWDGRQVDLHAYTIDGQPVWNRNIGGFKGRHGVGFSPIVYRDKVFLNYDQNSASKVLAFEAATGKLIWETARPGLSACYSTPFIYSRPGQPDQLIVASSAGIAGYDLDSGKAQWDWKWDFGADQPLRMVGCPVYSNGLVIAYTGNGGGARHTVAVKVDGEGERLAWRKKQFFPYVPCPLTKGNYLYFINDKGIACCYEAKTGENIWRERLGGDTTSSPIMIGDKIIAFNERGRGYVFAASPKFELLARNDLGEAVMATPAVADRRLFVRGEEHLFCIGATR